ncbi:hypothetical protein RD110_20155 [Rhodoferax koreense]|uniref:Uncharacterized protein n=1 Tax=Rhodoferax koreensis TaxID=1842727 RepID=A0A1P8JZR0_9BURK|nr:hypothetical protein [Rhodoferax koreense]APW39240.1 hypothetical protein RD110_20155 [Rhodoferax koreense]
MNAIKQAKNHIAKNPFTESAKTFADLVLSLESQEPFRLERLYELDLGDFDLALAMLKEWRLERYYAGKAKLYDFALQLNQLDTTTAQPAETAPTR